MRWKELFEDLEGQLDAADRAALDAEVRDRTRTELGRVSTADRLRASVGASVAVQVQGAGTVRGRVQDVGAGWLLVDEREEALPQGARDVLVCLAAVLGVSGTSAGSRAAAGAVEERLDLRWALRGIARDRSSVQACLVDGSTLVGTLDRVGLDHVDLAEHRTGETRRPGSPAGTRLVPLTALAVLRPR